MKTVKLTPKASQDLEYNWFYGYHHFGEVQADKYINHISDIFRVMGENSIGIQDLNWVNISMPYLSNGISFIFCRLIPISLLSVF